MPHQNTDSSRATDQNAVTPGVRAADGQRNLHPEPRSYVAPDVTDSSLAPPAAGEVHDYMDEGEALGADDVQQGGNHANRPRVTEAASGQGSKTRAANRDIVTRRSPNVGR
jgi:hypothetical protein